jgi:hypothetical protein
LLGLEKEAIPQGRPPSNRWRHGKARPSADVPAVQEQGGDEPWLIAIEPKPTTTTLCAAQHAILPPFSPKKTRLVPHF